MEISSTELNFAILVTWEEILRVNRTVDQEQHSAYERQCESSVSGFCDKLCFYTYVLWGASQNIGQSTITWFWLMQIAYCVVLEVQTLIVGGNRRWSTLVAQLFLKSPWFMRGLCHKFKSLQVEELEKYRRRNAWESDQEQGMVIKTWKFLVDQLIGKLREYMADIPSNRKYL